MKCTFSYLTELIDRSVSSGVFLNSKSMFNSSLFLAMETTELLQLWPSGGEVTTPHWGRQQRGRLMWTFHCWDLTRVNTPPSQRDARLWSHQIFTKISFKLPYPRFLHWDLRINPYLRRILQKSRFPHHGNTDWMCLENWKWLCNNKINTVGEQKMPNVIPLELSQNYSWGSQICVGFVESSKHIFELVIKN